MERGRGLPRYFKPKDVFSINIVPCGFCASWTRALLRPPPHFTHQRD